VMNITRAAFMAAILILVALTTATALASDPLGVYLGGAVGRAHVSDDETVFSNPLGFDEHHMAWKLLAGVRPISLAGAELEYIDFGHPSRNSVSLHTDVHERAAALFGVLYVPLPLPLLDIYAKAGVARLQRSASSSLTLAPGVGTCVFPCNTYFRNDQTAARFAYGAGAQVKISSLAVRAEYERINESNGSPDLLSLGVAWRF
jgi:opacity protein-like surface antigen